MAEEKELLTILSREEYKKVLVKLLKEFGEPKIVKRLALQCTDTSKDDLDTRIRITDGKVLLMQKIGKWSSQTRQELEVPLPSYSDVILRVFKILRNTMTGDMIRTSVIQTDSRIFENEDFEIKLTHQFGKSDKYNCEVEVKDLKARPEDIANRLNIPIHLAEHTAQFWDKWSKEVNFYADEIPDKELTDLIEKYLRVDSISINLAKSFLGRQVDVLIDRPLGTKHPKHGFIYEVNYGYIPSTKSSDGEELDAYYLGVKKPLKKAKGICVAIIHRTNDDDDKLIVVPENKKGISDEEINRLTNFQEQWFENEIVR